MLRLKVHTAVLGFLHGFWGLSPQACMASTFLSHLSILELWLFCFYINYTLKYQNCQLTDDAADSHHKLNPTFVKQYSKYISWHYIFNLGVWICLHMHHGQRCHWRPEKGIRSLEPELQVFVSFECWKLNPGSLQEH